MTCDYPVASTSSQKNSQTNNWIPKPLQRTLVPDLQYVWGDEVGCRPPKRNGTIAQPSLSGFIATAPPGHDLLMWGQQPTQIGDDKWRPTDIATAQGFQVLCPEGASPTH